MFSYMLLITVEKLIVYIYTFDPSQPSSDANLHLFSSYRLQELNTKATFFLFFYSSAVNQFTFHSQPPPVTHSFTYTDAHCDHSLVLVAMLLPNCSYLRLVTFSDRYFICLLKPAGRKSHCFVALSH